MLTNFREETSQVAFGNKLIPCSYATLVTFRSV